MNTNNKEALELLEAIIAMTQKESAVIPDLARDAIKLLQDNEDTEVQDIAVKENTCLCKEGNCPNCEYVGCNHVKPSSKVEKLKEFKGKTLETGTLDVHVKNFLLGLTQILIEDEE